MSLNRFELHDVSDLKIIGNLWKLLKLLMFLRMSQKYGYCNEVIKLLSILSEPVK